MEELIRYQRYTRKEVHDHFVPNGNFTPSAGTWGILGPVSIPGTSNDHVFFVTYGQSQGDHFFQEGISKDGVITWQSQPSQHLGSPKVLKWISQKTRGDKIYLFVRSRKGDPYTFFGQISYLSHDLFKEYPVWFEFTLNEWNPPDIVISEFVRKPTAGFSSDSVRIEKLPSRSSPKQIKKVSMELNAYDEHVRNQLTSNLHLIDAGEGYQWEFNYTFDIGDCADIVFFGPGREVKIVGICTSDQKFAYLKAVQVKLWRIQMCFELGEDENSEFIQCYLVAKMVNENTKNFCSNYQVKLLTL